MRSDRVDDMIGRGTPGVLRYLIDVQIFTRRYFLSSGGRCRIIARLRCPDCEIFKKRKITFDQGHQQYPSVLYLVRLHIVLSQYFQHPISAGSVVEDLLKTFRGLFTGLRYVQGLKKRLDSPL